MKKPKLCPECGYDVFDKHWAKERRLQYVCQNCHWRSEPFLAKARPVSDTKLIGAGGWYYEMFDGRGQTAVISRNYNSSEQTEQAARREIAAYSGKNGYGKCVAIVWPPTAEVKGRRIE